jgi:anti-sigma B factor antagonist
MEIMDWTIRARAVKVRRLPAELDRNEERMFLRGIEECLTGRRPALVLDCGNVQGLGKPGLRVILRCLEEAMKRNGDVRLAAVPQEARAVLEESGVSRLFRLYKTSAEAIASFQQPVAYGFPQVSVETVQPFAEQNAA